MTIQKFFPFTVALEPCKNSGRVSKFPVKKVDDSTTKSNQKHARLQDNSVLVLDKYPSKLEYHLII